MRVFTVLLSAIFTLGKKINKTSNRDFLESEFGYIKLRPRHETNPGEMKPHTSLNSKISRFSCLHAEFANALDPPIKNSGKNGFKKMGFC